MTVLVFSAIVVILGAIALLIASRMRMLQAGSPGAGVPPVANRYQPMLRLLRDDEFAFANTDKVLRKKLEATRRQLFRGYLRCLAKEYGQLLVGIRMVIVQSRVDRPDLAKALMRNRLHFALALCRVEFRLALHQWGIGSVDVSGLVGALESLRNAHANLLVPASVAA